MNLPLDFNSISLRLLADDCPLGGFSCGEKEIDEWVHRRALTRHQGYKARVKTAHDDESGDLLGLYSLTLILERERELRSSDLFKSFIQNGYIPTLHFEYLGVCQTIQNGGLGKYLTLDAIAIFADMAEHTGIPLLTLFPLTERLRAYYGERNFVSYGSNGRMMMSAETAIRLRDGG